MNTQIQSINDAQYQTKQDIQYNIIPWLIAIVLPSIIVLAMRYLTVAPDANQSMLIFIFLSAVMIWVLRLAAPLVSALYLLLGSIVLALAPPEIALSGFYSETFFLLISLSILGAFIQTSGLNYRVAMMLYQFKTKSKMWKQFVMFICGAIITPVIPSANGRAMITYQLFNESKKLFEIKQSSMEYQKLIATTIGGFGLLSPIFLTSKSINLLAFGMLPEQIQQDFEFFYWMLSASLVGIMMIAGYAILTAILFKNNETQHFDEKTLNKNKKSIGKITNGELATVVAIAMFTLAIFTKSIHQLSISWVAVFLLVFAPLILGMIQNKQFNKMVEWDFLIILSALIGFSNTMEYLNLDDFITFYLSDLTKLMEHSLILFMLYLAIATYILRLFIPINLLVIILCSALIPIATQSTINPWVIIFLVLLMAETSTSRITTSYLLLFFEMIKDNNHYWRLTFLQTAIHGIKLIAAITSIPFWRYLGLL